MRQNPTWLHEEQITFPNGETALVSYDTEGDILEIFFADARATATAALSDDIILRYDRQRGRPLSLAFIGARSLTQYQEFGQPLLALDGLDRLPESERALVLSMLQSSPLTFVIRLYSFKPAARAHIIPVAALVQPLPAAV